MVKKKRKNILLGALIITGILVVIFLIRFFDVWWGLLFNKGIDIKKNESGIVNILLLGIGGGTHDGPNLTDTIILASINPEKNTVNLISIPRDVYVPNLGSKINKAYAVGQGKNKQGIALVGSAIHAISGVKPDYTVVIDFSGFVKLIDLLGGIDVQVENTLDDYEYPVTGLEDALCDYTEDAIASFSAQIATGSATEPEIFPCRYSHLHVEEGLQHMDGELALKFARSRHAIGREGTDFARSRRQQLVIDAVRNKVLSLGTLTNPVKIIGMINILASNINMNIEESEYDDFIKLAQKMKDAKISNYVIDAGDIRDERSGLLINPAPTEELGYQWILSPRVGANDFSEIKEYIACILSGKVCEVAEEGILSK